MIKSLTNSDGPWIPISENVAKDFDTTAWVFTVYSISYIMASIITGFIFPKITRFDRKIIVMGVPLVLAGGVWTLVPEVTNFYSLVCVYIVTGKILLRSSPNAMIMGEIGRSERTRAHGRLLSSQG